jgi:hypothetical protein
MIVKFMIRADQRPPVAAVTTLPLTGRVARRAFLRDEPGGVSVMAYVETVDPHP